MPLSEMDISTRGAIKSFKEFRPEMKQELAKAYDKIGPQIVARAQDRAPVLTGALRANIRRSAAKTSATIRVGGTQKLPYGGPAHWGWDGKTGPWFLYRVGYPQATRENRGPVADWIYDALIDAMNQAVKRLNKHLGKDITLGGPAFKTDNNA